MCILVASSAIVADKNMKNSTLVCTTVLVLLLGGMSGCKTTGTNDEQEQQSRWEPEVNVDTEVDASESQVTTIDLSLDEFLVDLREAALRRNMHKLASLMTSNFGYQLNPPKEGDGVFQYWDEKNLWSELILILNEDFVSNGNFMVSPPEFADPSVPYRDYRAGLLKVDGEWKFAYFVRD